MQHNKFQATHLKPEEKNAIQKKLQFELVNKHFSVLRNASIASIIAAFLPVWALYGAIDTTLLLYWLTSTIVIHLGCIALTVIYSKSKPNENTISFWSRLLHTATFFSTVSYGLIGFLLVPSDTQGQIFILIFLIVCSTGIALGTSSDIVASVIGILSSLLPFVTEQILQYLRGEAGVHLQTGAIVFIYMLFLSVISYISYRLIKRTTLLSFENVALSSKLSDANANLGKANDILEIRVEERTHALQIALDKVTFQTKHDVLTELPNQESLYEFLRIEIDQAEQGGYSFGVACFSINQAELLINTFGYRIWTLIIKTVADRLAQFCAADHRCLPEAFQTEVQRTRERAAENTPSYVSSDSSVQQRHSLKGDGDNVIKYKVALTRRDVFAIIITPLNGGADIDKVRAIFSILSTEPVTIEGQEIILTGSIGVSVFPQDATAAELLLTCADATMYDSRRTKTSDDNLLFYKPSVNAFGPRMLKLLGLIAKAFYNHEFQLHYQPVVDLTTNQICGFEALSRWYQKELGFISPEEFIPLIQNSKISLEYDQWVLRTACTQLKNWQTMGYQKIRVSINLSEEMLRHPELSKIILDTLQTLEVSPDSLEIEFLETIAFAEALLPNFFELRDLGVSIAVDDFGKGHGDLEKIQAVPITKLKIDKSFIQAITNSVRNEEIVKNAIDLAKKMGAKVVAEGVETKEQLQFLRDNACDMIQGYLFSKPLPAEKITEILLSKRSLDDI